MKKKVIYRIGGCILLFSSLASCVGSDDSIDMMEPEAVTYEADIRPITQNICQNCHQNPPINGAPMPLTTYTEVRSAVETRGLLTRINSTSNPMPPTGLLPDDSREKFQAWVDQGFPEN